jgi:hypothetical protein
LRHAQLPAYIVALAFGGAILLLRAGQSWWAGLLFSLLWLKLQYVALLILFLAVLRQWVALLGLGLGSLLLLAIALTTVGLNGLRLYAATVIHLGIAPSGVYFANYDEMYNWRGLLERALGSASPGLILPGSLVLVALTYGLALWSWTAPTAGAGWRQDLRFLALALAMIIASPHVHAQDLILLLPALAPVVGHLWAGDSPARFAVSVLGLLLLSALVPQPIFPVLLGFTLHVGVAILVLLFLACVLVLRLPAPPDLPGHRIGA